MHAGPRKPLDALTSTETRDRARDYRLLAATVPTERVRDALMQLARMLERRAAEKEARDASLVRGDRGAFATGYADGRSIAPGVRPKAEALRPPFRTAYDAGYAIGRVDAQTIALRSRAGLRGSQSVGAVPTVTDAYGWAGPRGYRAAIGQSA